MASPTGEDAWAKMTQKNHNQNQNQKKQPQVEGVKTSVGIDRYDAGERMNKGSCLNNHSCLSRSAPLGNDVSK